MENKNPEFYEFVVKNISNGECINPEYKEFWEKVKKLRKEGKFCKCDNSIAEPYGYCSKCFLKIENIKLIYGFPIRNKRWSIYDNELYRKAINYEVDNISGAMVISLSRGNYWELFRWYIYNKQNGLCKDCNNKFEIEEMELHHLIPVSQGGIDEEKNLVMLCKKCHRTHLIECY